jgi:hypothetical protein
MSWIDQWELTSAARRKILTWCRIGSPPFAEKAEGGRRGATPAKEET